jgi:Rps23 Pro-64 3,4-dihydroxylase Tpa1-like proline 4-hydroxylase
MTDHNILNSKLLFDPINVEAFKKKFNENIPFRHIAIDDFLNTAFAKKITSSFPPIDAMKTHYSGINERKAEDTNFQILDTCFTELHEVLSSVNFLNFITALTGIKELHCINDRLGYGLHQGADKSFLDIHIDYNIHPLQKMQRRLNLILFFNEKWDAQWGGNLELWDSGVKKCVQSILPILNRAVIFECSEISYHGYSQMSLPENLTRKSYYQYFFTSPIQTLHYHDTVFKARPDEPYTKKITVPVKEFLKNKTKNLLLKMGLERFLK